MRRVLELVVATAGVVLLILAYLAFAGVALGVTVTVAYRVFKALLG